MLVYRICRDLYAYDINSASGMAGRWNEDRQYVLYTAESRALACLENLVHRSHSGTNLIFRTMIIDVPDDMDITEVKLTDLPKNWKNSFCKECLAIGVAWYQNNQTAALKVPSSIIPDEWNYILNTRHPNFSRITLLKTEEFLFDTRL
jgi:RES domain-containing protein